MLKYKSIEELVKEANKQNKTIGRLVLDDQAEQMEKPVDEIYERMKESFYVMKEAAKNGSQKGVRSTSGLTGCEGYKMKKYAETTEGGVTGSFMTYAMSRALAVSNCNSAMGKIVATPTAGSCGILPGCILSLYEDKNIPEEKIIESMFTAAGFGMVIAGRASVSGAKGGCQAECGSASGMAAAAVTEIMGGSPEKCAAACGMALSSQLGLVCDPVAGLVEIPCTKRNVSGVVIAFSSAEMALADIPCYIPCDECIDAMKEVGDSLSSKFKETAMGGLAATKTAKKLKEQVFGKED